MKKFSICPGEKLGSEDDSPQRKLVEILGMLAKEAVGEAIDQINAKLVKLVSENGTKVLAHTPECAKWRKEHNDSSEGCPGQMGCEKLHLIWDVLIQLNSHPARACRNSLESVIWLNVVVDAMTIITKILSAKDHDELKNNLKALGVIFAEQKTEIEIG